MFRRLSDKGAATVRMTFEGREVLARVGDTVAAALLAAGETTVRTTPRSGAPRGPFCLMGVCFDCLMVIDGQANRQACQVLVRDGMRVSRQQRAREIDFGERPQDGA